VCVCVCEKESSILCEMVCEMLNSCVMIKRLTPHFLCTCVNIPCPVMHILIIPTCFPFSWFMLPLQMSPPVVHPSPLQDLHGR